MYDYSLKIFLSFPSLQTLCLSWKRLPVSLHTPIYLEMHFPFVYSTKSHLHLCLVILLRAFAAISFRCSRNSDSLKLVVIYLLLTDAKKKTNKQTNKQASFFRLHRTWLEMTLLYIWLLYHRIDCILPNNYASSKCRLWGISRKIWPTRKGAIFWMKGTLAMA